MRIYKVRQWPNKLGWDITTSRGTWEVLQTLHDSGRFSAVVAILRNRKGESVAKGVGCSWGLAIATAKPIIN